MEYQYYVKGIPVNERDFFYALCMEYTKGSVWTIERKVLDNGNVRLNARVQKLERQPVMVQTIKEVEIEGVKGHFVTETPKIDAQGLPVYESVARDKLPATHYLKGDW